MRINHAIAAISDSLSLLPVDLRRVLQTITDQARHLADAEYAALGIVVDPNRSFDPWVFSGISPKQATAIGSHPRPVGLLGVVPEENKTLRLRDLEQDPRFRGFPPSHPVMRSFLGVPIHYRGKSVGNLYLANKVGAAEFSEEDEWAIELLAAHVAVALQVAGIDELRAEVEAQRAEVAAILDSSVDPIFSETLDGTITSWNPAAERLYGYKAEEVIGKSVSILMPPDRLEEFVTILERVRRGERIDHYETILATRDGRRIDVLVGVSPILDNSGRTVGASTVTQDITERRWGEMILRESEKRFRALVTASSEVLYRMSPDWSEMRQLHSLGFLANTESPSRDWLEEYIHPDDQPHVIAVINEAIQTKSVFELEHRVRRADGSLGWTFSRAVPIMDERGDIVEWFGAASDVTERKEADAQRERLLAAEHEARQQAERAVRIRDEFIAVAAHELKTPITSLRGFSQTIVRKFLRKRAVEEKHLVKALMTIDRQSKRLAALTEQLLNASRLEANDLRISPVETDLSAVVEAAIAHSSEIYPARVFLFGNRVPVKALLDPARIELVIANLLDNAVKFSLDRAPVEIETVLSGQEEVLVSVRDHGKGILEGEQERVFEKFYQSHGEKQYGGMGLGLYVAAKIVEMHGGTIRVEAAEGGGSRFTVLLPLATTQGEGNGSGDV